MVNIRMQDSNQTQSTQEQITQEKATVSAPMQAPPQQLDPNLSPRIGVIGVGGAGGNAVNNMIASGQEGCEFLACNSDHQALQNSQAKYKVQLGVNVTGGLGAGSKPEIGRAAAEESLAEVMNHLEGANMVFITAGMGGGTGTGAAPVIAKACREKGILTVGVVTKPFHFEGIHRMKIAEAGIDEMQDYVDTLIVIPNQNLFRVADEKTTFAEAFDMADSVLKSGVCGVTDLMVRPGLVNLDFADIRTAMLEMGKAMMGTGEAEGDKRAIEAAESAINNPLLDDVSMKGAHGVIINVTGGYDMTLFEADEACNRVRDEVDPNANIIFGATFDEKMEGRMRVSIVATGIERESSVGSQTTGGVQPSAQSAQDVKSNDPAQAVQSAPMVAPSIRPVAEAAPVAAAAPPESEMLDQNRFSEPGVGHESDEQASTPENTALRGTVYKDSFIPPKPMQAFDPAAAPLAPAPLSVSSQARSESSPVAGGITPVGSSLKLNPPKLPTAGLKKKAPSLFERIGKSVQKKIEDLIEEAQQDKDTISAPVQEAKTVSPTVTPRPLTRGGPAQGALNIDAPAAKPKEENSELDIPAFLRRQAN